MPMKPIRHSQSAGFTLMEVLVAAVVLGIGILGLVTLMVTSMKSDQSSFYRATASALIYDMADRIRNNSTEAKAGAYDNVDTSGTIPSDPGCIKSSSGCTPSALAQEDIREWANNFVNVNGVTHYASSLPNGIGTVTRNTTNNQFTITVKWNETDWDKTNPTKRANTTGSLSLNMSL